MTNYWLLLLPSWGSLGLLATVLILREHQNARIQKGLIDKILVKEGIEPLPAINPISELLGNEPADVTEKFAEAIAAIKRRKKQNLPTRFTIPNMPAGMGDISARGK